MLRSIVAVFAGFVVAALLVVVSTWIVAPALGLAGAEPGPGYLLFNLVTSALAGVLGGYVAARVAPHTHWGHVGTLAVILLLLSMPGILQPPAPGQPTWYPVLLAMLGPATVLLGGVLAIRSTQRHRAVGP